MASTFGENYFEVSFWNKVSLRSDEQGKFFFFLSTFQQPYGAGK